MMHYCEFPVWGNQVCGHPACAKIRGAWFCRLHEEWGEYAMEEIEPQEDADAD